MIFDILWSLGVLLAISLTVANTWFVMWMAEHEPGHYVALRRPSPLFFLTSFLYLSHPYMKGLLSATLIHEFQAGTTARRAVLVITVMVILFQLSWVGALLSLAF